MKSGKEPSELCEGWEKRAQQWDNEKTELEEMLLKKEKIRNFEESDRKEDIQLVTEENIQLRICYPSSSFTI